MAHPRDWFNRQVVSALTKLNIIYPCGPSKFSSSTLQLETKLSMIKSDGPHRRKLNSEYMFRDDAISSSSLLLLLISGLFHSLHLALNTPHVITGSYLFVQLYSIQEKIANSSGINWLAPHNHFYLHGGSRWKRWVASVDDYQQPITWYLAPL